MSKLENFKIGKFQNWEIQNWKISKLEIFKIGKCQNWKFIENQKISKIFDNIFKFTTLE